MKINEGILNFGSLDSGSTILDLLTIFYSQTNTSREMVNKKVGEITYKTNEYRFNSTPSNVDVSQLDANADWQMKMMSNISSKSDLRKIMQFISKLDRVIMKKALLINFMRYGLHIYMRDDFHLAEDIRLLNDPAISQMNEDYISSINDANVSLNKAIKEFQEYSEADITDAERLLYDFIENSLGKDALEVAKGYGYYLKTGGITNIKSIFDPYMKDEKDAAEFTNVLNIYRSVVSVYDSPSIGQLQNHFNIAPTSYKQNRVEGLNLMLKTLPKNFLSRVI